MVPQPGSLSNSRVPLKGRTRFLMVIPSGFSDLIGDKASAVTFHAKANTAIGSRQANFDLSRSRVFCHITERFLRNAVEA